MFKIIKGDGLCMDFVHSAGGVGCRADLVGIVLLPPVKRRFDVNGNENLSQELSVISACRAEPCGEGQVIGAENARPIRQRVAIAAVPTVHGIARASDGVFHIHHMYSIYDHITSKKERSGRSRYFSSIGWSLSP